MRLVASGEQDSFQPSLGPRTCVARGRQRAGGVLEWAGTAEQGPPPSTFPLPPLWRDKALDSTHTHGFTLGLSDHTGGLSITSLLSAQRAQVCLFC